MPLAFAHFTRVLQRLVISLIPDHPRTQIMISGLKFGESAYAQEPRMVRWCCESGRQTLCPRPRLCWEPDAEPEEARNPASPQLRALTFQQLKNSVLMRLWRQWRVGCLADIWAYAWTRDSVVSWRRAVLLASLHRDSLGVGMWALGLLLCLWGLLGRYRLVLWHVAGVVGPVRLWPLVAVGPSRLLVVWPPLV